MRISSSGNIIKIGSLQKGLILDMPLAEPYTEAGVDLVTNGTFTGSATGWSTGTGWAYGTNNIVATAAIGLLSQNNILVVDKTYFYSFDVGYTSGTVKLGSSHKVWKTVTATGTYTGIHTVVAGASADLYFGVTTNFTGTLDNIIIKELDGTTKDRTPQGNDGTVSGATITDSSYSFTTNDLITIGNVGTTAKTISFWINPVSTTESILEEIDNVGILFNAGTIEYTSWDNCFFNGVDTNTITTGWHHILLTSTTDVDVSALRLGLVDATYFEGELAKLYIWNHVLSAKERAQDYQRHRNTYE